MRIGLVAFVFVTHLTLHAQIKPSGILLDSKKARPNLPTVLTFESHTCIGVDRQDNQWYVLPLNGDSGKITPNTSLWILPQDPFSKNKAYWIKVPAGDSITATIEDRRLEVTVYSKKFEMHTAEARPHSDCFNNRYSIDIQGGDTLANTLAGFYWGTMLQSVVEKTRAKNYPYSSGYVISTLNPAAYAGSYPDVDHEFQIKGRLAFASDLDLDIVRRMMGLQFKVMQEDPEGLFRDPCSVQPGGEREYHIRRNSENNKVNAEMFLLTGNMEILEEAFHYFEATKDSLWLAGHMEGLEKAAALTIANMDRYGRVWSDVYYEDQVMKDGRETMSGALAAYTFQLLAQMENKLNRADKASYYTGISKKIARQLVQPLPEGFWDEHEQRFVDWVDRNGIKHDHIHLLANILPVIFGYATEAQTKAVAETVNANLAEFQRFPSFVSANVAAYDKSEIGDGGPYDLCAAGRYWWWDASYWKWRKDNDRLYRQLKMVATEAIKDSFYMGERYDMNHVYYIDGRDWHGADRYYEYPCVYTSVLIADYLGIQHCLDADLCIKPNVHRYGTIEFTNPLYNIRYTITDKGFTLKNLSARPRRFKVDLSGISGPPATVTLSANQEAHWALSPLAGELHTANKP